MNILGIEVSELSQEEVWKKIRSFLTDGRPHYIVTPNPEIILASHQDEEFFYILNQADLAPADGFGLKLAALTRGKALPRISGSDLSPKILELAAQKELRVAIINFKYGLSKKDDIETALKKKFPELKMIIIDTDKKSELSAEELHLINQFSPNILFTSLGAPYQEKIIWHSLAQIPSLNLALGVGGSFDFITGKIKRAPKLMRRLGLEWLFRLIKQPWRAQRIFKATFIFSTKVFFWRFVHPFMYRPNVACWLYRECSGTYEVLIVERREEKGHWQLPQGGTDGQSLQKAGARELEEELDTKKLIVRACYRNLYKYKMPSLIQKIYGYKGQSQGLCLAEFIGEDDDIKINFWDHQAWAWVKLDDLLERLHPVRRAGAKIFLSKFQEYLKQNNQ
ncbi:MAG: WecB/TagA/CpsF family glycosyltransferase [Patescibacteria group bacterium]